MGDWSSDVCSSDLKASVAPIQQTWYVFAKVELLFMKIQTLCGHRPGKPLQTLFENSVEDSESKVDGIQGHNLTAKGAKFAKNLRLCPQEAITNPV